MNYKKGFIWIVVLMVFIIVLAVGGVAYYAGKSSNISLVKVEENNLPQENKKTFKLDNLEFSYSDLLTLKKEGEVISLAHSIPQKHQNSCDFKGDGIMVDNITDFQSSFKIYNKDLKNSITSDFSANSVIQNLAKGPDVILDPGFVDKYTIGSFDGYKITQGVEGCGHYSYFLSISPNQTLVIDRSFYAQTVGTTTNADMLKLPGIISKEKEEQIFKSILLSVKGNISSDNFFTRNSSATTNLRKLGETCGQNIGNCGPGLKCAYPCGIPGCQNICRPEDEPNVP